VGILVSYTENGDLLISSGEETRVWPLAGVLRAAASAGAALGADVKDPVFEPQSQGGASQSTGAPKPTQAPAPANGPAPVTTQAEDGGWPKPLPGVTALIHMNAGTSKPLLAQMSWHLVGVAEKVELDLDVELLRKIGALLPKELRAARRAGVIPTFAVEPSDAGRIKRDLRALQAALAKDGKPQAVRIVFLAEDLPKPLPR
jgi:hypothetical protein